MMANNKTFTRTCRFLERVLETKNININLSTLRTNRNETNHYLLDTLATNEKKYRVKVLYNKLIEIIENDKNVGVLNKFNSIFPKVVNDVTNYLTKIKKSYDCDDTTLDNNIIYNTEFWWDEYN